MATVAPSRSVRVENSAKFFASPQDYLAGNYRLAARAETVRDLLGEVRGKDILDLGCGDGSISAPYARTNNLTLVDSSPGMIEAARKRALGARCIVADMLDADFGSHDLVLALGVLSHVDDTDLLMRAIARHLRPGGRAIVQLSDHSRLLTKALAFGAHIRGALTKSALRYRPMRLRDVLHSAERCGFTLKQQQRHLLLLPGMWRLLGRRLPVFDRFVRNHPWLASQATDAILLVEKH